MKEQLIQILGLDPKASDADVISAVSGLKSRLSEASVLAAGEKEIRALIAESGNALSRDAAVQVLADRKAHAAAQKAKAKK